MADAGDRASDTHERAADADDRAPDDRAPDDRAPDDRAPDDPNDPQLLTGWAGLTITTLRLTWSNVHLVQGERPILVDAGSPGDAPRVVAWLERTGVRPKDVAAIVLTHGHADHAGAASDLREVTGAPIILGRADESLAADGRNSSMVAQGLEGRLIRPFVPTTFPAFRADLLVDDVLDLRSYGVVADLHATGGHTPGSTIVRFASGDVIVGDLLRGGRLGGRISPQLPFCHYYAADPGAVARVLRDVLATRPMRLYVGHGGPLDGARVATRFDRVVPGGPR